MQICNLVVPRQAEYRRECTSIDKCMAYAELWADRDRWYNLLIQPVLNRGLEYTFLT